MWDCGCFDLLGVTVRKGPAKDVHILLEPGVTVLCGRNGSGKTTILRALEGALRGFPPFAGDLHCRLPTPSRCDEVELARVVLGHFSFGVGKPFTEKDLRSSARASGPNRWHGEDGVAAHLWGGREPSALATEIAEQGLVGFTPAGTREDPFWSVSVDAHPGEASAALRAELHALAEHARAGTWDELSDDDPGAAVLSMCEMPHPDESTWGHSWAPARISYVSGTMYLTVPMVISETDPLDVDRATFEAARSGAGGKALSGGSVGDEPTLATWILERLDHFGVQADELYRQLFVDAPVLRCSPLPPAQWFEGAAPVRWEARDHASGCWLPLEALSRGEQRWARVAIRATLIGQRKDGPPGVVILDEPEAAMHPLAVRHMVTGLKALVSTLNVHVVVATHSPELLEDPDLRLVLVSRDAARGTSTEEIDAPKREHAERLGCSVADLLQRHRVVLLVEGEHDRIVLQEVIGEGLDRARVHVVALRGGKELLPVAGADLLFDMTEAVFVVVLDAIRSESFTARWQRAIREIEDDRPAAAASLRDDWTAKGSS